MLPQLDPTWFASQLFWLAICMAVLYVALSRMALPPLMRIMEQRHRQREDDLTHADAARQQSESAKTEYEHALSHARTRAQALFADAEAKAKQASEQALNDLNRTLSSQLAEAERRIAGRREEVRKGLEPAYAELTSLMTERLTGARPSEEQVSNALKRVAAG